jgi:plastocyanin
MEREFNTGVLMPNNSAVHRFNEEIAIPYVCGVHPLMVGVIVVEEPEDDSAVQ